MFALEVTLLTGRYVATAFDRRGLAEWPPHPARLFSALVDAHFDGSGGTVDERRALEWLEELGAPHIRASEAARRDIATVFVPINDAWVVSSVDDEARELDDARVAIEAARAAKAKNVAALEKKLAKAEARFSENVRKAIAPVPPGKEGKDGPSRAVSLLPDRRERQPRTFPSVTPVEPRFVFSWPTATASASQRAVLDAIAARVVRLGHSSSLVTVRVDEKPTESTWMPDETGEVVGKDEETTLRTVTTGQLAALDESFARHASEPGRVMPANFQRYVRPRAVRSTHAPTTAFTQEWIILRRSDTLAKGGRNPRLPSTRAVDVARAVRNALLASYGSDAPEILSGHRVPGVPTNRAHLAIVPLPFVGHDRADGAILGVAVIVPNAVSADERQAVYRALSAWRKNARAEYGGELPILLGRAGILRLEIVEDEPVQMNLKPRTWCERSRIWSSVTPVALDRNPGELRSANPEKEAAAYADAEATIATACGHIGLPRPVRVTATPSAPFAGGDKARAFPPYAPGRPPTQRVLIHATIEFEQAVEGPILLGAGRYLGLGLFRPKREHG